MLASCRAACLGDFNVTYAPTGRLIEGFPAYAAGDHRHLHRHPKDARWQISDEPFDPDDNGGCFAFIDARAGPVPTGA